MDHGTDWAYDMGLRLVVEWEAGEPPKLAYKSLRRSTQELIHQVQVLVCNEGMCGKQRHDILLSWQPAFPKGDE
jgi:hypothetical protein